MTFIRDKLVSGKLHALHAVILRNFCCLYSQFSKNRFSLAGFVLAELQACLLHQTGSAGGYVPKVILGMPSPKLGPPSPKLGPPSPKHFFYLSIFFQQIFTFSQFWFFSVKHLSPQQRFTEINARERWKILNLWVCSASKKIKGRKELIALLANN